MQPESVAARLVTTHDACVAWQTKAFDGQFNLTLNRNQVPCSYGTQSGLLPRSDGKCQLPLARCQFERNEQSRRRIRFLRRVACRTMLLASRCHRYSPFEKLQNLLS